MANIIYKIKLSDLEIQRGKIPYAIEQKAMGVEYMIGACKL